MREVNRSKAALPVAKTAGNPEGKGVNGLLQDWQATTPRDVVVKPPRDVLAEFFTSMLVLSAQFKFKPTVGTEYYLYWIDGEWSLSLIAPDEWTDERQAGYAGTCVLQTDMTWTIAPSTRLPTRDRVLEAIGRFHDAFVTKLDSDDALEEILPSYVKTLPYFQRLYASALSRSLRATISMSDYAATGSRHWLQQLSGRQDLLPDLSG